MSEGAPRGCPGAPCTRHTEGQRGCTHRAGALWTPLKSTCDVREALHVRTVRHHAGPTMGHTRTREHTWVLCISKTGVTALWHHHPHSHHGGLAPHAPSPEPCSSALLLCPFPSGHQCSPSHKLALPYPYFTSDPLQVLLGAPPLPLPRCRLSSGLLISLLDFIPGLPCSPCLPARVLLPCPRIFSDSPPATLIFKLGSLGML